MKKVLLISALTIGLFSCKKDNEIKPAAERNPWNGTFHSINLTNDSTGTIADANTDISITEVGDSIIFSPVHTIYGSAYFYNVLSNQNTATVVVTLGAKLNGNTAVLNSRTWTLAGKVHTLTSGTITLNADNTKTLKYSETIVDTVLIQNHYTGTYK